MKLRYSMRTRRAINGYLFIMPWLLGFLYFYVRCLVMAVDFSLSTLTLLPGGGYATEFIALENFIYAFRVHASFKQVLTTSILNMVIDVPLIIFFSLFIAILLNREFKGRTVVRAIFFLPVILNAPAIVDAMDMSRQMMMGGLSSTSAEISSSFSGGGVSISYYFDLMESLALPGSVLDYLVGAVDRISTIITASGVQIIIFLAALQSIPTSLYEVSRIEGATAYETFWKVTFPLVMPHIITNLVFTIVVGFAQSEIVELAYQTYFTDKNNGLSAAFSITGTVVVCALLFITCRIIQKRTFYYN